MKRTQNQKLWNQPWVDEKTGSKHERGRGGMKKAIRREIMA
jgi:hypothetical protein